MKNYLPKQYKKTTKLKINHNYLFEQFADYSKIFKEIEKILGFKSKFTIEDAVQDLKKAFQNNMLPNSLSDEKYFNIKKMQSIKLS